MTMSPPRRARGAALLSFALVAAPAVLQAQVEAAEPRTVSTVDLEIVPQSGLEPAGEVLPLSLDEAITIALERNLGLLIERYERARFRLMLDENLGIYDLGLFAEAQHAESTSPTVSQLEGAAVLTQEQQRLSTEARQLTPWGGVASLGVTGRRQETNSEFVVLNPNYDAGLDFGITQPLLRNFGRLATERGIMVAKLNSAVSRENLEQQVATTVQQVINAYWALVEAREQLVVAREGIALAQELHEMNRVRVDVGTLAPLEMVQSEVGIAIRQEEIIRVEAQLMDAEDELRRLLNLDEGPLWDVAIEPVTEPTIEEREVDLDAAIATALANRPELRARELLVETQRIESEFWRNQKLPRLDLSASYGYSGIAGRGILQDENGNPVVVDDDLTDAFGQVFDRDFDGLSVLLTFAYPLQNRTARARSVRADLELEQGVTRFDELAQTIRVEVRSGVRGVRTAAQAYESAQASRGLAERNLEAEQRRYENGLSTSFQVLEIQEDLTAARSREVAALTAYRRALAEYYRATGRLLENQGIAIDDPLAAERIDRFGWHVTDPR